MNLGLYDYRYLWVEGNENYYEKDRKQRVCLILVGFFFFLKFC